MDPSKTRAASQKRVVFLRLASDFKAATVINSSGLCLLERWRRARPSCTHSLSSLKFTAFPPRGTSSPTFTSF